jgi:uncharacterized membrane protein YkoI
MGHRDHATSLFLAGALLLGTGAADPPADEHHSGGRHDHEHARHALKRGEIRPIGDILQQVAIEVPGEVIEVELKRGKGQDRSAWVYEIKLIAPDGQLREVLVDAATATLLEVEAD